MHLSVNIAGQMKRRLVLYTFVVTLSSVALAYTHGARIRYYWHNQQWEDRIFFQYNHDIVHSWADCFLHRGLWSGLYRPLTTNLYYHTGNKLFGDRIEPYHAVSDAFVILCAVALWHLAESFVDPWIALVAPLLFASRYALADVVLDSAEFQGLFYVFWSIISIDCFVRSREPLSLLAFVLALLSKEAAVAVPVVILMYARLFSRPVKSSLFHFAVLGAWALLFRYFMAGESTHFEYDLSAVNILRNYALYLLAFSNRLAPDAWILELAASATARIGVAVVIASGVVVLAFPMLLRGYLRLFAFGFGWFFVTMAPFVVFGNRLFLRYSIMGHAGIALTATALIAICLPPLGKLRYLTEYWPPPVDKPLPAKQQSVLDRIRAKASGIRWMFPGASYRLEQRKVDTGGCGITIKHHPHLDSSSLHVDRDELDEGKLVRNRAGSCF
jgi:hypothetical protein